MKFSDSLLNKTYLLLQLKINVNSTNIFIQGQTYTTSANKQLNKIFKINIFSQLHRNFCTYQIFLYFSEKANPHIFCNVNRNLFGSRHDIRLNYFTYPFQNENVLATRQIEPPLIRQYFVKRKTGNKVS